MNEDLPEDEVFKFPPPLTKKECEHIADLFKELDKAGVIYILSMLYRYGGEICQFELAEMCWLTQPTVSYYLRLLRNRGWVSYRHSGLYHYYSVDKEKVEGFLFNVMGMLEECGRAKEGD